MKPLSILTHTAHIETSADGSVLSMSLMADATDNSSRQSHLLRDPITHLPNRRLFFDRLHQSLARSERQQCQLAVLLVHVGTSSTTSAAPENENERLTAISQMLHSGVRKVDSVCHLGHSLFALTLESIHSSQDAVTVAKKLLNRLSKHSLADGEASANAYIGVSLFPEHGHCANTLLRHADRAMHEAKRSSTACAQLFEAHLPASATSYALLESDLEQALRTGQFDLDFQPEFDLQSGAMIATEALVRWHHPVYGTLPPTEFIPLAEESGFITQLGEWVLHRACQQKQHWLQQNMATGRMAINVSPRQFFQPNFIQQVKRALIEHGLSGEHIELEITESCAMENAQDTLNKLQALREMDIALTLDDFGTGYSSLAYLQHFPVQKLKIDKSFIGKDSLNRGECAIASSMITLGHNLAMRVVAEGVETLEQARWLKRMGCDQAQGYFFAKPQAPDRFLTAEPYCAWQTL